MKFLPQNTLPAAGGEFSFFPMGQTDVHTEGRDPHALVRAEPSIPQFPSERQLGVFLFLASLAAYLATMSWTPFPGLPTKLLLTHMRMEVAPGILDPLWGWLVRVFSRLPGLSVAGWTGLFSALCGAAGTGMIGMMMMRVGYLIRNEPGPGSFVREAQARRISGLTAGLYLAGCIPHWVASTRSLPESFHLLMLLTTAWAFSQYQLRGRWRYLGLLGILYGVGLSEVATFIVFLPLAVFLTAREMFRWRTLRAWRPQLIVWGGLLLGLSIYPLEAYVLYRHGISSGLFASLWQAWARILQEEVSLITQVRFSPGFPAIMFFCLAPWLTLFAMSRRSPWFYEWGQIAVRLIFVGGLMGVLYNASFAPWRLLGMTYLMVTPYVLLAICMGYMAGEFWILGEPQPLVDDFLPKRIARRVSSAFALLLSVVVLAGGAYNWRTANGRPGAVMTAAAVEVLDRLDGRDILLSTGLLDDTLRLVVRERRSKIQLISAPRTSSPIYLRKLAASFAEEALKIPLQQGDFGQFLENLLLSDEGPSRTVIIDMPDVFRDFGYLVPDGFLYRLATSTGQVDLATMVESQRPFWTWMERMEKHPAPEENLARAYQDILRLLASKVANNLGVMQAERGDEAGALETLRAARRICSENLSVLLNLLELGRSRELPEEAELEADWEARQEKLTGERWALAIRYGYVWKAREWVRRGWVWVLSGAPISEEAARRKPTAVDDDADKHVQLLDQAYLVWGSDSPEENHYRAVLIEDGKNTAALMALCRIALRRSDTDAAEAYMTEAMAMGLPEEEVLFDRAMALFVKGDRESALTALDALTRQTPGDPRVWMAQVLLTDEENPVNIQAIKTLKSHRAAGVNVRLVLAWVYMSRKQWAEAQNELETAIQLDSKCNQAWEMLVTLAQERGNHKLLESSLRALLARAPEHYLQYQNKGVELYKNGKLAEAEAAFRQGIQRRRDPTLLNNLASVIMERDGHLQDALDLVEESLRRQPGYGGFLGTRGQIFLKMGRLEEAKSNLQMALKKQGRSNSLLLSLAHCYEGLGDRQSAMKVAEALARQPDQLDPQQKQQVKAMLIRLR
jgi:predicted Zn-dependent protease